MQVPAKLLSARFLKRESRFSATVLLDGKKQYVHIPDSGRLSELLIPDREVFLLKSGDTVIPRKTKYSLIMTRYGAGYVSIDSSKAVELFEEALSEGKIYEFRNYNITGKEKRVGMSRIDYVLTNPEDKQVFVEVKSVTLVSEGRALFPDSPGTRTIKQIEDLIEHYKKGNSCAIVFIVQRADADVFTPNDKNDPNFGEALRQAFALGIKILAYRCRIDTEVNYITDPIPVIL